MRLIIWIGGAALCLAGLLVYGFNSINPNPMRWFSLSILVSCALVICAWRGSFPRCRLTASILIFVGYAALSILWSPDWREGLVSLNALALLSLLFVFLLHADRKILNRTTPIVASVASLGTLAIEVTAPGIYGGLGNENFQSEFLVLLAPLCFLGLWTWRGHYEVSIIGPLCAMCGCAALLQAIVFNPGDATKWAGLAGAFGLGLIILAKRIGASIAFVLGIAALAIMYQSERLMESILRRFELTYNTLLMWWDSPIFGIGLGGFNYAYPIYQASHPSWVDAKAMYSLLVYAGASHNEFAQALAVLGLAGCALFAIVCLYAWEFRKLDASGLCGLTCLSIMASLSLIGFPMQNPSTALLGVVGFALMTRPDPGFVRKPEGYSVSWRRLLAGHA